MKLSELTEKDVGKMLVVYVDEGDGNLRYAVGKLNKVSEGQIELVDADGELIYVLFHDEEFDWEDEHKLCDY